MPRRPRIYITGDTHGDIDIHKLTAGRWPEGRQLTKDDILIIAGDFGLVFSPYKDETERYWLDWLDECPWTTLFIDGNHENFDRLYKLPCEERYGGPVGVVRPSVLHLRQRGHVYTIAGKRFWCFGGATSIDKAYRTEGRSWWPQEEPTAEQMEYGLSQIEEYERIKNASLQKGRREKAALQFHFFFRAAQRASSVRDGPRGGDAHLWGEAGLEESLRIFL